MALSEHVLQVKFPSRAEALRQSRAEGAGLEVFIPTGQRPPIGRHVRVWVTFEDTPEEFELNGRVAFLRMASAAGTTAGVGVTFDGEGKERASEMLAFCAGAPVDALSGAKARRVHTQLQCRVEFGDQKYAGEVIDLSVTGVFVSAPKAPRLKVGARLQIRFKTGLLSWSQPLELRLMWHGTKRALPGFGARFVGDAERVAQEVRPYMANPK